MAEQLQIGTRVLFTQEPHGRVHEGIIGAPSPKGYVAVELTNGEGWWLPQSKFIILDVLPPLEKLNRRSARETEPAGKPEPAKSEPATGAKTEGTEPPIANNPPEAKPENAQN